MLAAKKSVVYTTLPPPSNPMTSNGEGATLLFILLLCLHLSLLTKCLVSRMFFLFSIYLHKQLSQTFDILPAQYRATYNILQLWKLGERRSGWYKEFKIKTFYVHHNNVSTYPHSFIFFCIETSGFRCGVWVNVNCSSSYTTAHYSILLVGCRVIGQQIKIVQVFARPLNSWHFLCAYRDCEVFIVAANQERHREDKRKIQTTRACWVEWGGGNKERKTERKFKEKDKI